MPCKKKSFATRCARSAHCCWCILARVEAHYSVDFYLSQQGCTHSKNGSVPGRAPTSASAKKLMVALTRLCIWRSRGWSTAQAAQPDARAASATRCTPCCLVGSEFSIARRSPLAPRPRPPAPEAPGGFLTRAAFGETVRPFRPQPLLGECRAQFPLRRPGPPPPPSPAAAAVRFFVRPRPCCAASDAAARPLCPRPPLRSAGVRL